MRVQRCEQATAILPMTRRAGRFVAKPPQVGRKPVLFVDIDGVISLWGFDSNARPSGTFHNVDGVIHFLSSDAANNLLSLRNRFELVWCSGWEEKANEHLPYALAVPAELPFLSFERKPGCGHGHWKIAAIETYARNRPLAWVDDALDEACHVWAGARDAPTLLVPTTPSAGLTAEHVEELNAWAKTVAGRSCERA